MPPAKALVLIPIKPLAQAKTRLASVLSPPQRQALTLLLLSRVLRATRDAAFPKDVALVAGDATVPRLLQDTQILFLVEDAAWRLEVDDTDIPPLGEGEENIAHARLNRALHDALAWAGDQGYPVAMVIAADLPHITPDDVNCLWHEISSTPGPTVVIAPDAREQGTNALALRPPDVIPPQFGPHSFQKHRQWAEKAGLPVRVCRRPGLAQDVDTVEDLKRSLPTWRR